MIELIISYFIIAFFVFAVTKSKSDGLTWPIATLKFIIESILKIISYVRVKRKNQESKS